MCYDVRTIPEGDWLCDPCAAYEAELAGAGKAPAQIRPPRSERKIEGNQRMQPLEGGARSVKCAFLLTGGSASMSRRLQCSRLSLHHGQSVV